MHPTEKSILFTFITGLSVLTLTLILIVFSVVRHQRRRMREFTSQLFRDMKLIEDERERIASDLHDDMGSLVAAVMMNLGNLIELVPGESLVHRTIELVGNIQQKLKQVSHNLAPQILTRDGLVNAVKDLSNEWDLPNRKVIFNSEIDDQLFVSGKSLLVYRIIQELIANAVKHGKPDHISIEFKMVQEYLVIDFKDDGIGFPDKPKTEGKHFGLKNIQSRLQLLGAKHKFHSAPSEGTFYQITIPLQNLAHE